MQYAKMNREFRKIYRNISNILATIYILITFSVLFVKPSWCQQYQAKKPSILPKDANEYPECTRFLDEKGKVIEFHRSNVPLFDYFTVSVFCWVLCDHLRPAMRCCFWSKPSRSTTRETWTLLAFSFACSQWEHWTCAW